MKKIISLVAVLVLISPALTLADSTVTASSDTGSSISPSGVTVVPTGDTQIFTASVNQGYELTGISVDGVSQGNATTVGFTGQDADTVDHTIAVSSFFVPTGGSLLFCSGPEAPGYTVGLVGGGCGGTSIYVPFNGTLCLFFQGCMIKE